MYRIDLTDPSKLVPCTVVPSVAAPGKTLCLNEDGHLLVVEPDGTQVRTLPPGDPAWDSPYTWAEVVDGFLVYRSATATDKGQTRSYKMVGA